MTEEANPRLAAALAYAARGWYCFPCSPRLKIPATPNGHNDATRDPERLRAWWSINPNYNVAIATGPSNLLVLDIDPAGQEWWAEKLAADPALKALVDAAPQVVTPRGGSHIYMAGEGPTTVGRINPATGKLTGLAVGVDTRGIGGYVMAPPSYVDDGKSKGRYIGIPGDTAVPPLYEPLLAPLLVKVERQAPALPPAERKWDEPETLERAKAWLTGLVASGDVAVEGMGGDATTFEVACGLLEMAINPQTAVDMLAEHWNPHCLPPWEEPDLAEKVRNAWRYGQDTKGGKAERPIAEQFAHLLADKPVEEQEAEAAMKARYKVKTYGEAMAGRKPLEWIIPDFLPRKGIGILFGQPETLKTFLLLDLALSIATGYGPNWWEGERAPQQVLFLAGESPDALLTKRVPAWLSMNMLPHLYALVRDNLLVVEGVPPLEMSDYYAGILDDVRGGGFTPILCVVDTLTRAMAGKDENSAKDATWTTMKLEWLSRELNAFVIAIHHSGKDSGRGARGSSVWQGNTDFMLEAERPSPKELSVLVHLRKLKEGGKTDLPLKFDGALYNETPALTRDWNFAPVAELPKTAEPQDTEEWMSVQAIAAELAKGPLTTWHLADNLAVRFGVEKSLIRKKLTSAAQGRLRAWVPNGSTWMVPATHPVMVNEEEF